MIRTNRFILALIRRVTTPIIEHSGNAPSIIPSPHIHNNHFSSAISIDPDGQLDKNTIIAFRKLHLQYDNVFNPVFGVYNDASGPVRASLNFGAVKPPSTKPKLPYYHRGNMQKLQESADNLENLGVLAKPEDLGVVVKFASPSFLVEKAEKESRFVTSFVELSQYTNIPPTTSSTCDEVLRTLSSFKFIIKTDLTKSFFQIPLSKSSIPYLGIVTPFKGLRVYTRSAMGMPGSSEFLKELLSRVFGQYLTEGFIVIKDDDMYIGASSPTELLTNWHKILDRLKQNNLYLSACKTVIALRRTTIF